MSNFSNNQKVKMIATAVGEETPYIKQAKSYMNQGELEGKKYGGTYKIYIPDTGTIGSNLTVNPDEIEEREVVVTLDLRNTAVEADAWEKLNDIESFKEEIAKPRGRKLAKAIEKAAIDASIFQVAQVEVGTANLATLSNAAAKLDEVSVADKKLLFIKPTESAKIAATSLAHFIPADKMKEIYADRYIGEYSTASVIEENQLPIIKVPASQKTPTISLVADGTTGFKAITSISGADAVAGLAYKAEGLKVVGVDGVETDQDYVIVVDENGNIPELRITKEGKNHKNPNAWVAAGVSTLTLVPMLENGATYSVGVVRSDIGLGFDTYKFGKIVGTESSEATYGNVKMVMTEAGDGKSMTSLYRLDCPFAVSVPDNRCFVGVYMKR